MMVFINPGHDLERDPGAVNNALGITEARVVADIGALVKTYLDAAGCDTMLMQSDNLAGEDGYSYRYSVCAQANLNDVDLFVSIHCNAATPAAKGTECFCYPGSRLGKRLATNIQRQLIEAINTYDRGVKEANFTVLKNTNMPACLVEIAFISNPEEAEMLKSAVWQDIIARAIARGITDYIEGMK